MPLVRKREKICYNRKGHRRQYNRAHALCILDKKGYRYTLRICNNSCFSTAAMVTWSRLTVMFYVNCLSWLSFCEENSYIHSLTLSLLLVLKLWRTMKITVFWCVTQCSLVDIYHILYHEHGCHMSLRKDGIHLPEYTKSHPKLQ